MSGGAFDYNQYKIGEIADDIEQRIINNGAPVEHPDEWVTHYPLYSPDIIAKFKEAVKALRIAEVYAHRIDWLLSGDDGDDNFLKRLESDLNDIKNK